MANANIGPTLANVSLQYWSNIVTNIDPTLGRNIGPIFCVTYLSVANIGLKSRTERLRKTKIGIEVAHVTRDSDTTFKVKGQGHKGWGRPPAQLVISGNAADRAMLTVCEQNDSRRRGRISTKFCG